MARTNIDLDDRLVKREAKGSDLLLNNCKSNEVENTNNKRLDPYLHLTRICRRRASRAISLGSRGRRVLD